MFARAILVSDLVVLGIPLMRIRGFLQPLLVLWDGEEVLALLALGHPDNGCDKLDEEIRDLQKRGIKVVKVVNKQALNMRAIVILSHCISLN
jgi:hypothetical protein